MSGPAMLKVPGKATRACPQVAVTRYNRIRGRIVVDGASLVHPPDIPMAELVKAPLQCPDRTMVDVRSAMTLRRIRAVATPTTTVRTGRSSPVPDPGRLMTGHRAGNLTEASHHQLPKRLLRIRLLRKH